MNEQLSHDQPHEEITEDTREEEEVKPTQEQSKEDEPETFGISFGRRSYFTRPKNEGISDLTK